MKRIAAILLLAGFTQAAHVRAADLPPVSFIPTAPSVPAPMLDEHGVIVQTSASSRILSPIRDRAGSNTYGASPAALPLPTGLTLTGGSNGGCGTCSNTDCGNAIGRGSCVERLKAWLCFRPTTGDALPKLKPHPYVGPIAGIFPCTSGSGCGTGAACGTAGNATGGCSASPACATGGSATVGCAPTNAGRTALAGRFGPLLPGRGCQGGCVPPSDDAFPGYHFAASESQLTKTAGNALPGTIVLPSGQVSYKPAMGPTVKQASQVDPLTLPLTRP